jgi:hypothetical protein
MRVAVHESPVTGVAPVSRNVTARWYAVWANVAAVATDTACVGTLPRNVVSAFGLYGMIASRSVRDAPGTASKSARAWVPAPVTTTTVIIGLA